ncbi:MAG: WYL domain-containing protein [Thaumarchaeota archaeon]|nr:WYL domain-containing protein [Nitrososphaerota archaeon]
MSGVRKVELTTAELRVILKILRAFREGLLVNVDEAWELDEYGERLVNARGVDRVIMKLEASLPKEEVEEIKKTVLLRRYHPYHDWVDENAYSTLARAFRSKRRVEIVYFSLERAEATKREVDIYYLSRRYIVAFDHLRKEVRKFRTSRVMEAKITKGSYEEPRSFDKSAYL